MSELDHDKLCQRAVRWLHGTMRCEPVYSRNASCWEIPDAIGWSGRGSIVVECKTSVSDFRADLRKYWRWKGTEHEWAWPYDRFTQKSAHERGLSKITAPSMGDYRYYFCRPEVLSIALVQEKAPDHGLVWWQGARIRVLLAAPKRKDVNKDNEIRYLRFAIINRKGHYGQTSEDITHSPEV
jgi:hypothetical protein